MAYMYLSYLPYRQFRNFTKRNYADLSGYLPYRQFRKNAFTLAHAGIVLSAV